MERSHRIVLGLGNPDRGDDAAGRMVARRLIGTLPEDVEIAELDGEATALVEQFDGAQAAFVVDASASGAAAGTIRRFDVSSAPLPQGTCAMSTHGFGLAEAIELARTLGQLPPRCVVFAIEGVSFDSGAPLSSSVAAAVEEVAERIRAAMAGPVEAEGRTDA